MRVSLLTGGDDPSYAIPLATSLADYGVRVEFIGNDAMERSASLKRPNIEFLNLRGAQDPEARLMSKVERINRYYKKLIAYAYRTESRLFHVLWWNKFELLDRTLMTMLYKLNGKKVVFTAHNVNTRKRDGRDSWINRTSLKATYSMLDHIFVHTDHAKDELVRDYGVVPGNVSIIPFGLNTYIPDALMSRSEARSRLGFGDSDKLLLFFGQIAPYKALDVLLEAMKIRSGRHECRLIIAGRVKQGNEVYWRSLRNGLDNESIGSRIIVKDSFIPDSDVPILFKAADALVLPYRAIYQSGPLSLAYRFGLPVIATRVGSFEREVVHGVTGVLCEPESPQSLARAIQEYFESDLYLDSDQTHKRIREIATERYSWEPIARATAGVYAKLAAGGASLC